MSFPSRLHRMFITSFKSALEASSFSLIENYIFLPNKERTTIITKKNFNLLYKDISHKMLKDFIEPTNYGSQTTTNITISSETSLVPLSNRGNLFPPVVSNNCIFDDAETKEELLMREEDYMQFIKENENKNFYVFKEELFVVGRKNSEFRKELFTLDNFATFQKKEVDEKTPEEELEEFVDPCGGPEETPKLDDNTQQQPQKGDEKTIDSEKQQTIEVEENNRQQPRPKKPRLSWKKNSLSIDKPVSPKFSTNKENNENADTLNVDKAEPIDQRQHTIIETQGKGDACCKISDNCSIF